LGGLSIRGEPLRGLSIRGEPLRGLSFRGEPLRGLSIRGEPLRGLSFRGESFSIGGQRLRGTPVPAAFVPHLDVALGGNRA
jgi:probable blue pigment (indigoidine) exporter